MSKINVVHDFTSDHGEFSKLNKSNLYLVNKPSDTNLFPNFTKAMEWLDKNIIDLTGMDILTYINPDNNKPCQCVNYSDFCLSLDWLTKL